MAFNTGEPIVADEVNRIVNSKINCFHYNISPQSTVTDTVYAGTLIVFFHIFSECAVTVIRNEFDNPSDPRSFAHTIKPGSALSVSTSKGQLSLINNSSVGGTAIVLAY